HVKGLIRDRPGDPKDYIQGARGLQRWVYNELGEAEDRKPVQVFKKSFPGDEAEVAIRTYQMQPERAGHILKLGGQLRAEALGESKCRRALAGPLGGDAVGEIERGRREVPGVQPSRCSFPGRLEFTKDNGRFPRSLKRHFQVQQV